ncbi:MAG: NAD(P)H-hydrate dehydratase [Verrucomicrobiota bacterium]|jgi:NAD(P)H-hydrate epimerase|nr:NAD(P)H-hydrate dehydratase [Verrucomicrobiota bacterium]
MNFVSVEGIRQAEAQLLSRHPEMGPALMQQAGQALATRLRSLLPFASATTPRIRFLAGAGNNGGDAFAAAAWLARQRIPVDVWLPLPEEKIRGSARLFWDLLRRENQVDCRFLTTEEEWRSLPSSDEEVPGILVDALLGTGASGPLRGTLAYAAAYMQTHRCRSIVVAVDVPTGWNAATGESSPGTVWADYTLTMGYPKTGMAKPNAVEAVGTVWVHPFDHLNERSEWAFTPDPPHLELVTEREIRTWVRRRKRDTHKGTFGSLLLVGGSAEYAGAMVLATEAAARSGAGRIHVWTSPEAAAAIRTRCPEAIMVQAGGWDASVSLAGYQAILIGPGLGRSPEARRLVARFLQETPCPLVLDADALRLMENNLAPIRRCSRQVVLTPHPGELGSLLGTSAAAVQQDRLDAAKRATEETRAVVVLKGAGTLIAKAGCRSWLNLNGNPGMATGGSGDVLAGLLTGWLGQGMEPMEAAALSVWLHGCAGDQAALRHTPHAMRAGDVVEELASVCRRARLW